MKKILPYILIFIIVLQLFAPFSVGSENGRAVVQKNIVSALEDPNAPSLDPETTTDTSWVDDVVGANKYLFNKLGLGSTKPSAGDLPVCFEYTSGFKVGGCFAQAIYYAFFKTTSLFFGLTGKILDFTIKYSIDDTSYRSSFVTEGWGLMRDMCNMFFIFVLLYIAFGTILNLHGVKTKEMIVNVVIIGLLINFSLFATQIIIDASNILTRVFYNQNTIVVGPPKKDAEGKPVIVNGKPAVDNKLGDFDEIKLSEAIVSKVDPQELIINATKINNVPTKNPLTGKEDQDTISQGVAKGVTTTSFIIITLLATAINVVGSIVFLSCALIFIGRVIMLWLAMIMAPLAFFSYTVPQLQDIEMIGWKKWWPATLKMAFVAPVFAFFVYIIIGFLDKGLSVVDASLKTGHSGLTWLVSIIVPFAFIMILLMKAKSIAVSMSGEVGAALSKAGAAVGGIALGAATGGAAMALRGTLGAAGSGIANSKRLALAESKGGAKGWAAKQLRNIGSSAGKGSFDVRSTKLGAAAGTGMGVNMGKAKEGGFEKYKAEKDKSRKERADNITKIITKDKQKGLQKSQIETRETMLVRKSELEKMDKLITATREKMDAARKGGKEEEAAEFYKRLLELQKNKTDLRDSTKEASINDDGDVKFSDKDVVTKSVKEVETAEREALHEVSKAESSILNEITKSMNKRGSRIVNLITSFGQDRRSAVEKTSKDLMAGIKVEKDTGNLGGHK